MKSVYIEAIKDTPSYVFNIDFFAEKIKKVSSYLQDIPLCYSMKANPFIINTIPKEIKYLEVCSPGELRICEESGIDLTSIIFSGVNKTREDVIRAIDDNVGVFTGESLLHINLINECSIAKQKTSKIILRLSCGNQFGMDESDIKNIICQKEKYSGLNIIGIHYYAGTQKKKSRIIEKELAELDRFLDSLRNEFNYIPEIVEYGPGLASEYFNENHEAIDETLLNEVSILLKEFAKKYPLSIEMGRFLASDCGIYFSKIVDTKVTHGINYAICDGGIHHLKYYGQTMSMQIPPINIINPVNQEKKFWSLCGSLCTTADVLIKNVELIGAGRESVLAFGKCGAYSVTEGPALFLSRDMPSIYTFSEQDGLIKRREHISTFIFNR